MIKPLEGGLRVTPDLAGSLKEREEKKAWMHQGPRDRGPAGGCSGLIPLLTLPSVSNLSPSTRNLLRFQTLLGLALLPRALLVPHAARPHSAPCNVQALPLPAAFVLFSSSLGRLQLPSVARQHFQPDN